MKQCQNCGIDIPMKRKANNVKFCSLTCRNKFDYQRYRKQWQKDLMNKRAKIPSIEKIECQICHNWYKQVGSHIVQAHNMKARQYRKLYGFDLKRGQLQEKLRLHKAKKVFENGTVENLKVGQKFWFKKGQKDIGTYERSEQTMKRLKQQSFIKNNLITS